MLVASVVTQSLPERELAGVVMNAETNEAVAGAIVAAGDRRTVSDREGRFSLRVPSGRTKIDVTVADYFTLSTTVEPADRDVLDIEFVLAPRSTFSSFVDVVAAAPVAPPATVAVAPMQVLSTPGALDNVFRTLQTLPGVSATEEFGSRLTVRGGAPDQNLTIMDGVEIHDPYRLFGLTSAFNPEIIQRFELSTGGFSVKHGDRLSSLLLVENRDGTRERALAGSASLSVTDLNVVLEGRLPRAANGSWLVTRRRTYYNLVTSRVTDQEFPGFADVQGKGVWEVAPGRTVSAFGLRSRQSAAISIQGDAVRGEFNDDTSNDLAWLRFDASIGTSTQSHTLVGYSNSTSTFGVDAALEDRSKRSNAPDDAAIGLTNVVFDWGLAPCRMFRCGRSSSGRPARTSWRLAANCITCLPACRPFRFVVTAILTRPTDWGLAVQDVTADAGGSNGARLVAAGVRLGGRRARRGGWRRTASPVYRPVLSGSW